MNFGNIFSGVTKAATGFVKENIQGGASAIISGTKAVTKNLLDEAVATAMGGGRGTSIYDSPYPLGQEWVPDPAYTVTLMFTNPNTGSADWVQGYMPETISIGLGAEFSSPLENAMNSLTDNAIGATARLAGYKVSANLFSMLLWSGSSHADLTLEMRFTALADTYQDVVEPIRKLTSLITPTVEPFSVTTGPLQLGIIKSPGPTIDFSGMVGGSLEQGANNVAGALGSVVGQVKDGVVSNASNVINGESSVAQAVIGMGATAVSALGGEVNNLVKNARIKNNISVKLGSFCYMRSVVIKDVSPAYNVKCDENGAWTDATVSIQISTFVTPTNIDIPDLIGYTSVQAESTAIAGASTGGGLFGIGTPGIVAEGVGMNFPVPNIVTQMGSKVQVAVTTKVGELYDNISSDLNKVGRDVGLSTKVTALDPTEFKLGMSSSDYTSFTGKFNV